MKKKIKIIKVDKLPKDFDFITIERKNKKITYLQKRATAGTVTQKIHK